MTQFLFSFYLVYGDPMTNIRHASTFSVSRNIITWYFIGTIFQIVQNCLQLVIVPKTVMSLEECLEYIKEDEYVEVTPKSMRMRKIILDHLERKRANKD